MHVHSLRYFLLLVAAALAALLGGCASTEIVDSWRDPALAQVRFQKVLVVFQNRDPQLRRVLEAEMARDIPNATPAHVVFKDEEVRNLDLVRERVKREGFDSAVIMRIVGVDRELSYVPGFVHTHPHFWPYWRYGWSTVYEPAYLRSDRIVRIATHVYSVEADKLVWASTSETFNPASLRGAIEEVVRITSRATGEVLRTRG